MRGEFIRGDGLVIPNNITTYGIQSIFAWAFQAAAYDLHFALVTGNPASDLDIGDLTEPTIGVNGYARQPIAQDAVDWLTAGLLNDEPYLETKEFVFAASGGAFDAEISRMALIDSLNATSGELVVALSNPLADPITIDELTDVGERTFKYRIYGR